jgi:hypothetical protein
MTCLRKPNPINGCKANGIRRKEVGGSMVKLMNIFIVLKCLILWVGWVCVSVCGAELLCVCRGVSVCGRNQNARK